MIADQLRYIPRLFNSIWKLEIDSLIQSRDPIRRLAAQAHMSGQQFLGFPVNHDMQVDPAENRNHHFGHIGAPISIGLYRSRFVRNCFAWSFEPAIFRNQQIILPHKAMNPLLINRKLFMISEICPDTTITPIWMFRLQLLDLLQ